MKTISIYLAGNIKKSTEESSGIFWTEADRQTLQESMPDHELIFLNPATRTDDLTDTLSVFGRDMMQVAMVDLVLVDARERRGLGVGAEMMWAKVNCIPLITLAPLGTHYHLDECHVMDQTISDYIHPFIDSLSDGVANSLQEAAQLFLELKEVKDLSTVRGSMQHYRNAQYPHDLPMQELIGSCEQLREKLQAPTK
ncbi:MAG: hypothetical protein S4CHLAM81_04610 [Chlamydiales bacterium]|nr:hypothetical protein [Chlamydiales bacterium]MCH9635250.1 hypothetical protein [Chlamydiales bacterium]MCH9703456.1 hypothetical protein [Chlamydiota bacterium]